MQKDPVLEDQGNEPAKNSNKMYCQIRQTYLIFEQVTLIHTNCGLDKFSLNIWVTYLCHEFTLSTKQNVW